MQRTGVLTREKVGQVYVGKWMVEMVLLCL